MTKIFTRSITGQSLVPLRLIAGLLAVILLICLNISLFASPKTIEYSSIDRLVLSARTVVISRQHTLTTKVYRASVPNIIVSNASLSKLTLSSGAISPSFAPGKFSYIASVANSTSSVTVTPTAADTAATIKVNGSTVVRGKGSATLPLLVGANKITITVTAQDAETSINYIITVTRAAAPISIVYPGTPPVYSFNPSVAIAPLSSVASGVAAPAYSAPTYKITLTRQLSADATLATIKYTPAVTKTVVMGPDYQDYVAAVPNTFTAIAVIPVVHEAHATVKVNGGTVGSGATSAKIPLNVGVNEINTVVTAQDGITMKNYKLTITRSAPALNLSFNSGYTTKSEGMLVTVRRGISPNGMALMTCW